MKSVLDWYEGNQEEVETENQEVEIVDQEIEEIDFTKAINCLGLNEYLRALFNKYTSIVQSKDASDLLVEKDKVKKDIMTVINELSKIASEL